ncbi:MAG: DUF2281 domain-containing protein [Synergistaceae bacterium]|jgi:hypothetical protein|nr:DUF2281 domain-containing protein [Synergistaceae bacterium]
MSAAAINAVMALMLTPVNFFSTPSGQKHAMKPITTEAVITDDHKLSLNLDLPKDSPTGKVKVTVIVEAPKNQEEPVNRAADIYGVFEGQKWMSDDFDEPLEDFAQYM